MTTTKSTVPDSVIHNLWPELQELTVPQDFSDVMAKRDNFFHSCWMRLKQQRPDLWHDMADCELYIAGLGHDEEDEKEKKDDTNSDGTIL